MEALLAARDLTKRFGGLVAVDGVDFDVRAGEIVGLIGPNGAGKTTIFNLITGIYPPSAGTIRFRDEAIAHPPPSWLARLVPERGRGRRGDQVAAARHAGPGHPLRPHQITARGIARTFQTVHLFRNLTALENVMAGVHHRTRAGVWGALLKLRAQRREEAWIVDEAERALARLDLAPFRDELAKNLPYGLQRRLEVARALAAKPALLALDEPAAGLNEQETGELIERVRAIRADGITVFVIEHDMAMVMALCEHIVVVDHGRKIAEGTPAEVQKNADVIAAYLGEEDDEDGAVPDAQNEP